MQLRSSHKRKATQELTISTEQVVTRRTAVESVPTARTSPLRSRAALHGTSRSDGRAPAGTADTGCFNEQQSDKLRSSRSKQHRRLSFKISGQLVQPRTDESLPSPTPVLSERGSPADQRSPDSSSGEIIDELTAPDAAVEPAQQGLREEEVGLACGLSNAEEVEERAMGAAGNPQCTDGSPTTLQQPKLQHELAQPGPDPGSQPGTKAHVQTGDPPHPAASAAPTSVPMQPNQASVLNRQA